jgi:hypothetical protein
VVRIWLDPDRVDYGAPVTVVINGRTRRKLTPVRPMLQRVRETGGTSRRYRAFADLAVAE